MLLDKYNGKLIDILLQGDYQNEELVKDFLEHIFEEKKIKHEQVYNIPYFTNEIKTSFLEQLFPLKTIPKNFNNHKNTFIDKNNKYFQINLTLNINNYDFLIDLENFLFSFKYLILNNNTEFLLTIRSYYNNIDTYLIKKNKILEFKVEELDKIDNPNSNINKYISMQHNKFHSNFSIIEI